MAKKKVYAVKKGLKTGIFHTWDECKQVIEGYSGAEYKGFQTEEEAQKYLGDISDARESAERKEIIPDKHVIAYVDGSFDSKVGKYSFGRIILTPNGETIRESGNGDNPESLAIRNVAGEMLGAMFAVKWAIKNGYTSVEVRYDYEGIEKWVTGAWKAKTSLTQKYTAFMNECGQTISVFL